MANSDVSDTSAGMYEMTSQAGIPVNGACPQSLSGRRRMTPVAAQIIANSAATTAAAAAGGSSGGGPSSATSGAGGGGLAAMIGSGVSTATEQQLSRMLDKIYETIELNELRLLIQDHKDAVKLEWQQVSKIVLSELNLLQKYMCQHYYRTRSAAVAKKADRTAYNVQYSCGTEPSKMPRLKWRWSRVHAAHGYSRR